jgi:thiamine-monophosphate kinase
MGGAEVFSSHTPLREGVEFDVVRRFLSRWGRSASGIGDDAAVLDATGEGNLIATTDSSVENVHFRRDWLTAHEVGYRAAASSLSDLAAMGASPIGILCAVVIPSSWLEESELIADGIADAARASSTVILGGDLSSGGELSITVSALGVARRPLLRSTAKHGDFVYVTGRLGGPSTAISTLLDGNVPAANHRDRFARPIPRIKEALWLAERGVAACIDISDGLIADLGHVAAASDVSISIDLERIPAIEGVSQLDAVASGEEYELAVTSSEELDAKEFVTRFGVELTRIGNVSAGTEKLMLLDHGVRIEPPPGYLHFSK